MLLNECLLNLGLAAVGVTLISFLLLGSWSATAVVVLSVLLVDVFLFGLMHMDGIRFNRQAGKGKSSSPLWPSGGLVPNTRRQAGKGMGMGMGM